MTNLLQFTIYFRKSHRPVNPTMHFGNSCAKIGCCSPELIVTFLYADSNIENASEQFVWCIHIFIVVVNFALHPNPQTKI